ncbi:uncharacterized protein LOC128233693 isoform X1 [Mya arenaria]|uniref:uncharacterized protein LOC128233693 isoform X1 n=1 Tax=Mya arenaria TaxID=6604 RepID=UPI0022E2BAED|nr:uncharacterized protein LOC128233693 isoform X1 [Mya arenaria]
MKLLVLLIGLFLVVETVSAQQGNCHTIDSCSCVYDDGVIVNLTSLARTDGLPNFSNKTDNAGSGDTYSWNPCVPFSYIGPKNNTECEGVAVCMIRPGFPNPLMYDLGKQDSANFNVDENGTLTLTYTSDQGDFKRTTTIILQCFDSTVFDFFVIDGEQDINNVTIDYKMTLASKWSCAYAPSITPAETPSSGLNGGVIFVIVVFSLLGAYLIFGGLYQALIKKESGMRLCPNHQFWCAIPNVFRGKKSNVINTDGGNTYESI